MPRQKTREWVKHVLWISRVKLLYTRITLTRYTTLYFFLALLACLILVILQSITFRTNTQGASELAAFLSQSNVSSATVGLSFLNNGDVVLCHNIPGQAGSNCTTLVHREHDHMHVRDIAVSLDNGATPDLQQCAISLLWLSDVLSDARREDLVVLAYQIWLFSLSVVTLLNESLPHLFAGLAARALSTGWAGFRVHGNINLYNAYTHVITTGNCDGIDPLGSWWDQSGPVEIAGVLLNALDLVLMSALSYKLFSVYASQTFSRVGASADINRIYKLVLLFSVVLQLAGFFTLVQTALWIGKISFGPIRQLAEHFPIYLAELVITAVLEIPWLVLGWTSVRRESKMLFLLFASISFILFGMATALFISPFYQFVFEEWSFYATISVAAYILLVATSFLAVICRLKFGKGLAHFLRVTHALDDGDFTPVYFTKARHRLFSASPTYISPPQHDNPSEEYDNKSVFEPELSALGYHYPDEKDPQRLEPVHARKVSAFSVMLSKKQSESSTIHLSSTPALFLGLNLKIPSPIVLRPVERSTSLTSFSSMNEPMRVVVQPVERSTSITSSTSARSKITHLDDITVGSASFKESGRHTKQPVEPPQAVIRSMSSRQATPPGLPRRPMDGGVLER
ncbi:hypothetical protein GGX14DRAFT_656898 [Mycena pura]|uniref:Uncharacterized protein n=1 Tax=Mycena pura TaxID=153505 RepID=A0AAD7E0M2_9AGAR|nr:hypothetical protein GGX14DRAFT_656898 [Mycena pura]